mmetsp:Transcript_19970/g.41832  ORF Transcript_19970/g.41832 Transcript_19970/m.41832 type:complete len:109 (-) Transcript_19970:126-452(-)
MGFKDVLYETIVLSEMQASAFGGDDSGSVLAAMLEHREAVEKHLVDVIIFVCEEKSKNSAHFVFRFRYNTMGLGTLGSRVDRLSPSNRLCGSVEGCVRCCCMVVVVGK